MCVLFVLTVLSLVLRCVSCVSLMLPVSNFIFALVYTCFATDTNYMCAGDITISTLTLDTDFNRQHSQPTLTCISTGGPATTVTWTRDSVTVTEGMETVLDDPVTAQYIHTLTVIRIGEYTCIVANNKPSSTSATITVEGWCFFHEFCMD